MTQNPGPQGADIFALYSQILKLKRHIFSIQATHSACLEILGASNSADWEDQISALYALLACADKSADRARNSINAILPQDIQTGDHS